MMQRKPDAILLVISILLVLAGILILTSVSASYSLQKFGTTFYFLNHQLLFGLLPGLVLGAGAFFLPLEWFKRFSFFILLGNILLLLMVFLPGMESIGGARRWIFVGPFSLQPSEPLKLTLILYVASWLATKKQIVSKKRGATHTGTLLTPIPLLLMMTIIGILLIAQPDISTLGLVALVFTLMYFSAQTPLWHTVALVGIGFALLLLLIYVAPYRLSRLMVFFDPSFDPLGQGYQAKQALIAIGSGGLTGVGLGLSFQKFGVLPQPISDSIFAIFSEEMGFAGALIIIVLFLLLAWRGLAIARNSTNPFSYLVAIGIVSWITLQAFINIGSMIGVLPLAGIPIPFISYGGSALATELIALGILLNISKQT